MKRLIRHAFRFGIVGVLAMATHYILVILLVTFSITPLIANVLAFIGAFQVSYWGHSSWSFSDLAASRKDSFRRFVIISVSGFLINELLFFLFLKFTHIPYQISLLIVLPFVAGLTFLFSRHWAFAR
jgi:putative flippase GtrA